MHDFLEGKKKKQKPLPPLDLLLQVNIIVVVVVVVVVVPWESKTKSDNIFLDDNYVVITDFVTQCVVV
jgi:hypothetical protein